MAVDNKIILWDGDYAGVGEDGFQPYMEPYLVDSGQARGAVLICPGGGYGFRSDREAEPVARSFNRSGLNAFVVHYSIAPRRYPLALMDLSHAVRKVRLNAERWNIRPDKLAVCGFSAGGHLAANLAVGYERECLREPDNPFAGISNRPDAAILCYPVITSGEFKHAGSFENLLGGSAAPKMLEEVSLEKHVTPNTPPSFVWHTVEDAGVPVENSLFFAMAMRRNKVPFELHIFPNGPHGYSLATEETSTPQLKPDPHIATWFNLSVEWLLSMGF